MSRFTIACFASLLAASPLLAETRVVTATPSATEVVNWTAGVSYTYDGSGNVRQIGNDRFVYDQTGRLVQAQINGVTRVYTYDAFGNRTGCMSQPGTPSATDCQLGLSIDSASNRVSGIRYDKAGNVETYYNHTYTYDDVNMPVRDDRGAQAKEFVYTAGDERIAVHDVGSGWSWTIRDVTGKVLREFSSTEQGAFTWARDYVYRDGLLMASLQHSATSLLTYHYHLDHLGTPRRVTDQNNRIAGFHDYHAFGPEVSGGLTEPTPAPLQYTGHERDKWGGSEGPDTLDYMHSRYYSPVLGRFLSVDPLLGYPSDPQSWNRYAYTQNDPMNRTDPDGREDKNAPCPGIRGDRPCALPAEPDKSTTATAEKDQKAGGETSTDGEKMMFFPEDEWSNRTAARLMSVPDNTILINSHGTPRTVNGMNPQQLADKIRNDSKTWRPGTAIILNSCNSARGNNSIAQELSKILQTSVTGNDQPTWTFGIDIGTWGTYGAKGGPKSGGWPDFRTPGHKVTFVNGKRVDKDKE